MNPHSYLTIDNSTKSEFKDRGSKFYGFAFPIMSTEDVKLHLKNLKEQHPKAIHFCYAYRLGISQDSFRANDDGEPSGSAGKPILSQIDSASMTNILIIVIRYWGGVLLGVPGLINAYKTAAFEALKIAKPIEKDLTLSYKLEFDYTIQNEIMRVIKQNEILITQSTMGLFCAFEIAIPLKNIDKSLIQLNSLYTLKINELK